VKRKTYGSQPSKLVKTSISLPEVLVQFAEQQIAGEGHNSLSSYLGHLLRLAKDREDIKEHARPKYPPGKPQDFTLNEPT
jgi:Arc/MetJ-type ribon-helix-helix transcriptional regulator